MNMGVGIEGFNAEHYYLDVEGSFKCHNCQKGFYRTCGYDSVKDIEEENIPTKFTTQKWTSRLCVGCYREEQKSTF